MNLTRRTILSGLGALLSTTAVSRLLPVVDTSQVIITGSSLPEGPFFFKGDNLPSGLSHRFWYVAEVRDENSFELINTGIPRRGRNKFRLDN